MERKIYFCTFADTHLQPTLNRIAAEAKRLKIFEGIFKFNQYGLDKSFRSKHEKVLRSSVRGFGYWIWKPYIIKKVLCTLKHGEILLYTDAGCCFNEKGIPRFKKYIDLVDKSELGIMAVSLEDDLLERKYTKGDLFDYFNVRNNVKITNTPQIQAGVIFLKKNKKTIAFIDRWIETYEFNFNLINDEPSKSRNFPDFISHRHDQSIFSILFKINKGVTIPLNEVYVSKKDDLNKLENYPIWYIRRKNKKIYGILFSVFNYLRKIVYD